MSDNITKKAFAGIKHLFILNPRSFWNVWKMENVLARIYTFFDAGGDFEIAISQFPRDSMGIIHSCIQDLPEGTKLRVYAVGGDGILFDCLNGIMGLPNVELGAIPYGRTNNFIRGFCRKSKKVFRNLGVQCSASAVPIDVIHAGNNYAICHCAVGAEAEAVRRAIIVCSQMEQGGFFSQWLSRKLYESFYIWGGVRACLDKKLLYQNYEITVDGETSSGLYRGISMFNSPYYGGSMHPVNSALPNDGILDALIPRSCGILKTCCLLPFYVGGRHKKFPRDFIHKRGRKITIRSEYPLIVSLDDIVFFDTELTVELLPGAVQFIDPTKQGYQGIPADG